MLPNDAKSLDANAMTKSQGSAGYVQAKSVEKVWEVIKVDALWENGMVCTAYYLISDGGSRIDRLLGPSATKRRRRYSLSLCRGRTRLLELGGRIWRGRVCDMYNTGCLSI